MNGAYVACSSGGTVPPAAMFYYSRDRAGEHPQAHLANYAPRDRNGGYRSLLLGGVDHLHTTIFGGERIGWILELRKAISDGH